jgi:hypothetical protein
MYFTDTYLTNIKPVMTDWLTNSLSGNSVTDLVLDYTNRAQQSLWAEKPWTHLEKFISITPDSNNQYTLPTGADARVGKIVRIGEYLDNELQYEYKEGDNPTYGYSIDWDFTKAAGYAGVITFNYVVGSNIKLTYIKALDIFTGTGTEYSYFPAILILLAAQRISALEKGNVGEFQGITASYDRELKKFENATQNVNADTRPILRDRAGNKVQTPHFSLGGTPERVPTARSNKYIGM